MIALSHLNKFDSNLIWYNELLVEAVLLSKSKESVPLVKKMIESQSSKIGFLLSDVLLAIGETETDSASQEEFENFIIFNKLNESYLQGNSLFRERRHGEVQVHFFRFLFLFSNSKRSNFKVFSVWRKLFEAVEKTENWKLLLYVCRKQKEFLEKESNEISKAFLSKVNSSITETISKLNYVDIFSKGSPAVSSTKKRSQDKENKESKERREEKKREAVVWNSAKETSNPNNNSNKQKSIEGKQFGVFANESFLFSDLLSNSKLESFPFHSKISSFQIFSEDKSIAALSPNKRQLSLFSHKTGKLETVKTFTFDSQVVFFKMNKIWLIASIAGNGK